MNPSGQKFNKATSQWNIAPYMPKPRYYCDNDLDQVIVPGSSSEPFYIWLSNELHKVESNITIKDLDVGSIVANTALYAYFTSSTGGVLSKNPPTTGPYGYDTWSYIGAVPVDYTSAAIDEFQAVDGMVIAQKAIATGSDYQAQNQTLEKVYGNLPTTAVLAHVQILVRSSVGANALGAVGGRSADAVNHLQQRTYNGSNEFNYSAGWVAVETSQTLYIYSDAATTDTRAYLLGWKEEPWRYT